jgi:hypothetical protein
LTALLPRRCAVAEAIFDRYCKKGLSQAKVLIGSFLPFFLQHRPKAVRSSAQYTAKKISDRPMACDSFEWNNTRAYPALLSASEL